MLVQMVEKVVQLVVQVAKVVQQVVLQAAGGQLVVQVVVQHRRSGSVSPDREAESRPHWLPDGVGTNGVFTEGPELHTFCNILL